MRSQQFHRLQISKWCAGLKLQQQAVGRIGTALDQSPGLLSALQKHRCAAVFELLFVPS
jgi:hypothetical protein